MEVAGLENIIESKSLVSVIIPVKDAEDYLEIALESIFSQSYKNIEVVVIDDNSSDSSLQIAKKYADRIVFRESKEFGVWAARNLGVSVSKGEFLAFQDADDIAFTDRLSVQMAVFHSTPSTDIVFGNMIEFSGKSEGILERTFEEHKQAKLIANCPGAMLISREAFARVGEFDNSWKVAGFLDWYMRAVDLGLNIAIPEEVILARRVHQSNSTLLNAEILPREYLEVVRSGLARRGQLTGDKNG